MVSFRALQSGYPVSMDGKNVDFIGHGTEEVRTKEDGSGAFIVPIDTPDTRKDPKLTERRQKEAMQWDSRVLVLVDSLRV